MNNLPGTELCSSIRELLSARLDNELHDDDDVLACDTHLNSCVACQSWLGSAEAMHRTFRISAPVPSPDVSGSIMAMIRAEGTSPRIPPVFAMARVGLVIVSLMLLVGTFSSLSTGGHWSTSHIPQELFGFQVALSVAFAAVALRPSWAPGVAVSSTAAAVAMILTAVIGARSASTSSSLEFNHVLEVAGAVLTCALARRPLQMARTSLHGTQIA